MIISEGKHKGEPTEWALFKDPYYVHLLIEYSNPVRLMPEVREDFQRLIKLFNAKEVKGVCRKS